MASVTKMVTIGAGEYIKGFRGYLLTESINLRNVAFVQSTLKIFSMV